MELIKIAQTGVTVHLSVEEAVRLARACRGVIKHDVDDFALTAEVTSMTASMAAALEAAAFGCAMFEMVYPDRRDQITVEKVRSGAVWTTPEEEEAEQDRQRAAHLLWTLEHRKATDALAVLRQLDQQRPDQAAEGPDEAGSPA